MSGSESSGPLAVTGNLIALERGSDELLLLNSFHMRSLYVARGRGRIRQILAEASRGRTLEGLKSAFARDGALIQMLRDHLILVDTTAEAERYGSAQIARAAAGPLLKPRMTVYLLLTESCNLGCIYCLNGSGTYHKEAHSRMTPEVALQSVTACLDQLTPGGHLEVAFFGGEPLLNWPMVKEVIRLCGTGLDPRHADKKITYHLTSNLTLCPPDLIGEIKEHRITVMSDIDGPADIHDRCRPFRHGRPSHAQSAETIRRLTDAGIPVALRATVTSVNQHHIHEIAAHHKELGASNSAIVPVSPINSDGAFLSDDLLPDVDTIASGLIRVYHSGLWDKKTLFPFNQYLLKLRPGARQVTACAAPSGTTPVVRVNGDVYLCIYLVGQERHRFGTLGAPWDHRPLVEMTEALHVDNVSGCDACSWRYACGGGCPVIKLAPVDGTAGGIGNSAKALEYGRKINCEFTQAILTELLWDMADETMTGMADARAEPGSDRTLYC